MRQRIDEPVPDSTHPRLWVRRFVIVEKLSPFTPLKDRDIPLHRGLNIVWGIDSGVDDDDLLAGHSVGKTLFCRLIRYGLGEDKYASVEFQQQVEAVLPEAYLGLEVVVKGEVWCVLRPLCREKSMGKGIPKERRKEWAGRKDSLEEFCKRGPFEPSDFNVYGKVLKRLAAECLPRGFESLDPPFDWSALLQMFARDQEARFVDVMVLRSSRSRTSVPLDHDHSDMMVRSVLGLADAEETRLAVSVQNMRKDIADARRDNAKKRDAMWAVTQQLMSRYQGAEARTVADADGSESVMTADHVIEVQIAAIKPKIDQARKAYVAAQKNYDSAYDEWRPVEEKVVSLEKQLEARSETEDQNYDQELRDLDELKRFLHEEGHMVCEHCDRIYDAACKHRLDEESIIRNDTEERRAAARERRKQGRRDRQATLVELQPWRVKLREDMEAAEKVRDEEKGRYDKLELDLRELQNQLIDVKKHLEGVKAIDEGRVPTGFSKGIKDVASMETALLGLEQKLENLRMAGRENLGKVESAFQRAVHGVLSEKYDGIVKLENGRVHFALNTRRGQGGEAVDTLTVLLFDMSTLLMTVEGNSQLPGLLIHDSPREADMQRSIYDRFFGFAANQLGTTTGEGDPFFQYIITTTTPPPDMYQNRKYVALKLSGTDDGLLLRRRIPDANGMNQLHSAPESGQGDLRGADSTTHPSSDLFNEGA